MFKFIFLNFASVVCLSVRHWLLGFSLVSSCFLFFPLVKALCEMTHTHPHTERSRCEYIRILLIIKLIQEPNAHKPNKFRHRRHLHFATCVCVCVSASSSEHIQIDPEISKYYVLCICLGQTELHQSDQNLRAQNLLESESIERRAIGRNVMGKVFLGAFLSARRRHSEREREREKWFQQWGTWRAECRRVKETELDSERERGEKGKSSINIKVAY